MDLTRIARSASERVTPARVASTSVRRHAAVVLTILVLSPGLLPTGPAGHASGRAHPDFNGDGFADLVLAAGGSARVMAAAFAPNLPFDQPAAQVTPMPKPNSPPINIPGTFAAVAVDGTGRWGASIHPGGSLEAERDAIRRCGGGKCHVVMQGAGRCVAFAQSRSGGYWIGFAHGNNRAVVQSIAMRGCTDGAPRGSCRLEHVNCL